MDVARGCPAALQTHNALVLLLTTLTQSPTPRSSSQNVFDFFFRWLSDWAELWIIIIILVSHPSSDPPRPRRHHLRDRSGERKKKLQIIYHYQTFFLTHVIKLNKILRPHYYRSYGPLAVLFCLIVIVAVAVVVFSLETFAIAIFLIINSRLQVNCKWFHFTIPVSVLTSSPALLSSPKPEMPFHRASAWSRDRQHHNNFQRHKFDVKWIFNNWM